MPLLAGLPEAPCARCGKRARIAWGELCPLCQGEREGKAITLSRWIALGVAILAGFYALLRIPVESKWYAAIAVAAIYLICRRIVTRLAMEFLPRDWEDGRPASGNGDKV
jgi:hypothetical protein